ncbi:beta-N-acetylhexosaminidase OS=Streptomyces albaduncus OX=68172 GN=FHS32_000237 PE=3 SV=1 [Streptomyces griseoloalbus]
MTLEEKVGQLFVMRVYGHSATDPDQADIDANLSEIGVRTAAELVAKYRVGGIIYFAWAHNTRDPHQIADLSNGIQKASFGLPRGLPVLISTDQEHGIVARVGEPATLLPGAMSVGAGGFRSDARNLGRVAGRELRALGIRQTTPRGRRERQPGQPGHRRALLRRRPGRGRRAGRGGGAGLRVVGCGGHRQALPGPRRHDHGQPRRPATIHHTREQWEELDAPPFRAAIAAGIDSIMTAHIVVPALDGAEDPATLSHPILTGILREELGYDGVVVTDSLGMEGVRTKYGDDRVPVLALKAGVDQLLNPPSLDVAWNAVLQAVRDGGLTEARLDESILRVLRLKARLGLLDDPYVSHAGVDRVVGTRSRTWPPPTGSPSTAPPCWSTRAACCRCPPPHAQGAGGGRRPGVRPAPRARPPGRSRTP